MLWFSGIRVGAAPVAASRPVDDESGLAEIVRQQVERDFTRHGRVGLVVGVVAGDEEVLLGFGERRLGDSRPPDADTLFEIGSITKVFTGTLLAQRIENGELKLDDRVAELLPEDWVLSPAAREITLRHCTTHTSGLPRLPANLIGFAGVFPVMIALGNDEWRLPNHLAGAGGIRSTGRDMLTFLRANMGRLPPPLDAAIDRSHQELHRAEMRMGMNWIHSFKSGLSRRVIWHNGGTGGFSTYLGFTDDRQYGVFVLSNTASSVDTLAVDILEALDQEYAQGGQAR